MLLSAIIPAYNESSRLPATLSALAAFAPTLKAKTGLDLEIIVVDNASTDGTADVARSALRRIQIPSMVVAETIKGKGAAVRTGMLLAQGELRMFMDADNSVSCENILRMVELMDPETAIVIASRSLPGSVALTPQPAARKMMSRLTNFVIRTATGIEVRDTQCGFKMFRAQVVPMLFQPLQTIGWGFDVEILARAHAHRIGVKEMPITWSHREGGHITIGGVLGSAGDIFTARRAMKEELSKR